MKEFNHDLLLTKINSTHWAKHYPDAVLPFDDYYKVLLKPSEIDSKVVGYFAKTNTTNKVTIYKNCYEHYLAQVVSFKKFQGHIKYSKDQITPSVSVATYIDWYGDIVLLNHFDAIGRNHTNDYSCYDDETRPLFEMYYTDTVVEQNGQTYYHSNCPHFHFSSAIQTQAHEDQEHPNAISIKQLLIYLNDLKNCKNEDNILLKKDLNMPFLNYHTKPEKYKYISIFPDLTKKMLSAIDCKCSQTSTSSKLVVKKTEQLASKNVKNCDEIIEFLHKIEHIYNITKPQTNIDKIILDLKVLLKLIKKFQTNLELVAIYSNAFVKSVNMKAVETELYKDLL